MQKSHLKTLLIILVIAVIARLLFSIFVYQPLADRFYWGHHPGQFNWYTDDKYDEIARNIVAGRGYTIYGGSDRKFYPNLIRPPVYPYILATQFYFFGDGYRINLFINIIFQSLVCVILFYLTLMMFNSEKISRISAMIWALYPLPMLQAMGPHSEAVYEIVMAAFIFFFYKFYKFRQTKQLVFFSISLVLLTLTRPISILFPLLFAGVILFDRGFTLQTKTKQIIVLILIFAVGLFPWMYRGYKITGEVIPLVSYKKPINYYLLKDNTATESQKGFLKRFNKEMKDPVLFIKNYLIRLARYWHHGHSTPVRVVNALLQYPLLLFSLLGIWRMLKEKIIVLPILVTILYFWLSYGAVHAISRYSFPLIILLSPCAAYGVDYLSSLIFKKKLTSA